MAVTVSKSELRHDMPMELAGWLLKKLNVPDNAWLLELSEDARAMLACNLVTRWSGMVNVVVGMTQLTSNKVFPSLC